jgi:hypothetical protein
MIYQIPPFDICFQINSLCAMDWKAGLWLMEAVGVPVHHSISSSILTLLFLLLRDQGKQMTLHSVTAS